MAKEKEYTSRYQNLVTICDHEYSLSECPFNNNELYVIKYWLSKFKNWKDVWTDYIQSNNGYLLDDNENMQFIHNDFETPKDMAAYIEYHIYLEWKRKREERKSKADKTSA